MSLEDLVSPEAVVASLKANTKKQAIQELSERAGERFDRPARDIFDQLLQRERLGSTGIGHGVAIPHARLNGLDKIVGLFARLERPIDFEAVDDEPVDLLFLLLAPEGEGADHLKALSRIARALRDTDTAKKLRLTRDPAALYAILATPQPAHTHAA
ncbi:MAG: PTS IIA-like nitrogen regulatory protein PtsN [Pseudomonadota bacterium]